MKTRVEAVLFDKDGTLFDFGATWDSWAGRMVSVLSDEDPTIMANLASIIGFDLKNGTFLPESSVIADTHRRVAELFGTALPGHSVDHIERFLAQEAAKIVPIEPVPLVPLLAELAAQDLSLGVMTNDLEELARAHLQTAGVERIFDFIAGSNSGFGAKPSPEPLLHFAKVTGHAPEAIVMVGDSVHDLEAGRAAGMKTVGVLTGLAAEPELAPWADVVLPHIGHLPGWL